MHGLGSNPNDGFIYEVHKFLVLRVCQTSPSLWCTSPFKETMPLIKSSSAKAFKKNLGKEIGAGKPPAQAAAIAYSVQRKAEGKPAKKPTKKAK